VGNADLITELRFFIRHTGPALSPFNAWVLSKSLETLSVRMERHCANALAIATHFAHHAELDFVRYPYLASHPDHVLATRQMSAGGGIVVLELKGGLERARRFIDALELLSHTPNLGDVRSIVTHPTSTTHSRLSEAERVQVGIVPGMIRVSVGLEHRDDLIDDVEQALERSR
jgi:O-succinylhomoserine sulfhydrylase